ncbi:MAG: PucC family protein [Pseudomonadota bacterium]
MFRTYRALAIQRLARLGPRYLPFADVASDDLPLLRLLRLSLFQVSVGMALVLLVGTLNRVMIVELAVPATLVGVMISLPLVFAPFRALIGHRSDMHRSALGWRRIPFIWKGSMLQFGGFAIMPFALLVLSGYAEAADAPRWIGYASAALAFLLVGAGVHIVQTVGLALATDLAPPEDQPRVVGLMYVMLMLGMILSALVFGALLSDYTPGRLIQVIQASAVLTLALNIVALWKQEARDRTRAYQPPPEDPSFAAAWRGLMNDDVAVRRLVLIGLGTMGFGMAEVLLEPYGGQVLALSVSQTTKLTALFAFGGILGLALASYRLGRGGGAIPLAALGTVIGAPAFLAIMTAGFLQTGAGGSALIEAASWLFVVGVIGTGFGAGLFGHATLTATMRAAPKESAGFALGAWGAVQATAAGVAIAIGGVLRDLLWGMSSSGGADAAYPYAAVFGLEIVFLIAAAFVAMSLMKSQAQKSMQTG